MNMPSAEFSTSDRKSTRLNSSHANISYAVFCLKKKKKQPGAGLVPEIHRSAQVRQRAARGIRSRRGTYGYLDLRPASRLFFFNDTATTEIYTLSLHDALPIFASLAPGVEQAERTPGRSGDVSPSENGYLHCGPNGAGHFVKMVHNGIEYGIMAAYAEGLNILKNANAGKVQREYYQYDLDLPEVTEVWRRGSVVGSWLLDLTAASMQESPDLSDFAGRVSDSGEGRWTSIAAIDEGVPTPVLTTALYERFASRGLDDFADKVLSAMRKQFGGHDEKKA